VEEFLQQLTNGLAVGGIYALIALGYTMVYGVLKLINFAHGDLFTYGAYLGLTLLTSLALTDRLGFILGVLVLVLMVAGLVAILGAILERAAYRPLRGRSIGAGRIDLSAKYPDADLRCPFPGLSR